MTSTIIVATIVSSGFGSGRLPIGPGTAGSASFLVLWVILHMLGWVSGTLGEGLIAIAVTIVGLQAVRVVLKHESDTDPQWIVIDEWAGMSIALIGVPYQNPKMLVAAFVLFRLFDVWKPGPVAQSECMPGALGVMADDLVAGLLALCSLALLSFCLPAIFLE